MCLLAIQYKSIVDAPIVIAANREERYDRAASAPQLHEGSPRVLCGVDLEAGGTWLGVNEHGVVVAVTNRRKSRDPADPPSRGILCRTLLSYASATSAIAHAMQELSDHRYAGANFLCADANAAAVIHAGDQLEVVDLQPGLHVLTNGDVNDEADDRLMLARRLFEDARAVSAGAFLSHAAVVCAAGERETKGCRIVIRAAEHGTVSSTLIALTSDPRASVLHHTPGPPDRHQYEDLSRLLRNLLG